MVNRVRLLAPWIALLLILPSMETSAEQWWRWGRPKASGVEEPPPPSGDCTEEDPTGCPLLTLTQVIGASEDAVGMRLPSGSSNGRTFNQSAGTFSYNKDDNTLYVATRGEHVAEISIPGTLVNSGTYTSLNAGTFVQGFQDAAEGQHFEADECTPEGYEAGHPCANLWSIVYMPDRLYGTHSISYDSGNSQRKSHWSRPHNLSSTGDFKGMDHFAIPGSTAADGQAGWLSGLLSRIPEEWQPFFGGRLLSSGQCCQSIITRNSYGPALGVFDHTLIGSGGTEPYVWKPLVYYPNTHQTLGCWDETIIDPEDGPVNVGCQSTYFGYTTQIGGSAWINHTRTVVFFGTQGQNEPCYGYGTTDPELHLTPHPDGENNWCFSNASAAGVKANHQEPRGYFVWLYDINDFVDAYNGTVDARLVEPYDGGFFEFPITTTGTRFIGGTDYDPATKRLIVSQQDIDVIPCCQSQPLIWFISVSGVPDWP